MNTKRRISIPSLPLVSLLHYMGKSEKLASSDLCVWERHPIDYLAIYCDAGQTDLQTYRYADELCYIVRVKRLNLLFEFTCQLVARLDDLMRYQGRSRGSSKDEEYRRRNKECGRYVDQSQDVGSCTRGTPCTVSLVRDPPMSCYVTTHEQLLRVFLDLAFPPVPARRRG